MWGWYDEPQARYRRIVAFCDTAFKTTQRADYSVIALWGERRDSGGYDILDVWRDRVDFPGLLEACEQVKAGRWRPTHWVVEDKASGQSLVQVLQKQGFPAEAFQPGTRDKLERVHAVTGYLHAGRVHLPRQGAWTDGFVAEHADFPEGAFDDMTDTTAMALHWFEVSRHR